MTHFLQRYNKNNIVSIDAFNVKVKPLTVARYSEFMSEGERLKMTYACALVGASLCDEQGEFELNLSNLGQMEDLAELPLSAIFNVCLSLNGLQVKVKAEEDQTTENPTVSTLC